VRVLFVSDVYFPRVNGVSTSINTFRTDLARCDVETLLVAPRYGAEDCDSEPGITRVAGARVPGDPEDRRMRWGELKRTLRQLGSGQRFDVVHVHTPFIAHYGGTRFARAHGTACVATYHTFFEEYLHHYVPALPRRAGRLLARAFTRSQCRDVQALIAPSEPMRAILREYGVTTPIHVVPTGLPQSCFTPGDGGRFRASLGVAADRPLVLYVGRVAHEKNIGFLVEAFARVRAALPAALLVIAGEGPARAALTELVAARALAEHVRFVGYLDRERALLDCYAAADVFVFASRTETQGLVLLEAMAQGAPLVSTAELGAGSILTPASGAVVVPESLEPFAAAVVRVLGDAALRATLAARGRLYAQSWSSLAMAQRLAGLYGELSARGTASAGVPAGAPGG